MYIEVADKAGFCFGVKRAIELAENAASKYGEAPSRSLNGKVYTRL